MRSPYSGSQTVKGPARGKTWPTVVLFILVSVTLVPSVRSASLRWGGSVRGYQFLRLGDSLFPGRRDTEIGILRLSGGSGHGRLSTEAHLVFTALTPFPKAGIPLFSASERDPFLPLQRDLKKPPNLYLQGALDRLNVEIDWQSVRLKVGRQAITWGVTYFWSSLDLFVPFEPQRVDRDYKTGVDAVRLTVPVNSLSEVELVGAVLGDSWQRDGTAGVLARLDLGPLDLGLMAGRFHRDTVGGGFITADLAGTGIRAEITRTRSGDPRDLLINRKGFWRGSVGVDRQLTADLLLSGEVSWNGYGASRAADYVGLLQTDRFRRGEVNALGQLYSGILAGWRFHPLWSLSHAAIVNWNDASWLLLPTVSWSTGNKSEVLAGAQLGFGQDLQAGGAIGSEFGSLPHAIFGGLKLYF